MCKHSTVLPQPVERIIHRLDGSVHRMSLTEEGVPAALADGISKVAADDDYRPSMRITIKLDGSRIVEELAEDGTMIRTRSDVTPAGALAASTLTDVPMLQSSDAVSSSHVPLPAAPVSPRAMASSNDSLDQHGSRAVMLRRTADERWAAATMAARIAQDAAEEAANARSEAEAAEAAAAEAEAAEAAAVAVTAQEAGSGIAVQTAETAEIAEITQVGEAEVEVEAEAEAVAEAEAEAQVTPETMEFVADALNLDAAEKATPESTVAACSNVSTGE